MVAVQTVDAKEAQMKKNLIREFRDRHGFTQERVSLILGIHRMSVSRKETGLLGVTQRDVATLQLWEEKKALTDARERAILEFSAVVEDPELF
jgi:DNA-binding XRE family transcriptional regulator